MAVDMAEKPVKGSTGEIPRRFPCPGCGASLEFAPRQGSLACPYCGREEKIPATPDEIVERSFEDYLKARPERRQEPTETAPDRGCASCGATLALGPGESAGTCPFCTSSIVLAPAEAQPWVAPESLLPFANTRQQAADAVRSWLASRWFAPSALKRIGRPEAIQGVYLPFWTYDAHATCHYSGLRGEHYTETESYTVRDAQGREETRRREVVKTRWFPASGTVARWFDDVLVPATLSLPRERLDALEPWDLATLRPYDAAYLAGFRAQRYQTDVEKGFDGARELMTAVLRGDVEQDIGGDEQRILDFKTSYAGITYKHLLLPVWIGAFRFRAKIYQVLVNARTGEVQGDRPYSFWKIAGLIAILLGALAALVLAQKS